MACAHLLLQNLLNMARLEMTRNQQLHDGQVCPQVLNMDLCTRATLAVFHERFQMMAEPFLHVPLLVVLAVIEDLQFLSEEVCGQPVQLLLVLVQDIAVQNVPVAQLAELMTATADSQSGLLFDLLRHQRQQQGPIIAATHLPSESVITSQTLSFVVDAWTSCLLAMLESSECRVSWSRPTSARTVCSRSSTSKL